MRITALAACLLTLVSCARAQFATPTAVFPGGVVTNEQLKIQTNGIQTFLTANITPTSTLLSVANCNGVPPTSFATIDQEIIAVTGCSGSSLTVDTASPGCTSGRACDGSGAASHVSFAPVSLYVVAWHNNALAAEVKAIETTLGSGLGNVPSLNVAHNWTALQTFTAGINVSGGSVTLPAGSVAAAAISGTAAILTTNNFSGTQTAPVLTTPLLHLQGTTYASLPFACTAPFQGYVTVVQDATVNTWGATVSSGGGAFVVMVFCDGSVYSVIGK
jgi:hypothetical protein